jgi:DNA-binding transcriptional MerR regulator
MISEAPSSGWSLDELVTETGRLLETLGLEARVRDGRVSPAPDARTVRYYTTLGLIDRPRIEGREARYGRRQLVQLAAIKALQAEGLSLGAVQQRLYGRREAELDALLRSAATSSRRARPPVPTPIAWREVVLEPGLRLLAAADWRSGSREQLVKKFEAAIGALDEDDGDA